MYTNASVLSDHIASLDPRSSASVRIHQSVASRIGLIPGVESERAGKAVSVCVVYVRRSLNRPYAK